MFSRSASSVSLWCVFCYHLYVLSVRNTNSAPRCFNPTQPDASVFHWAQTEWSSALAAAICSLDSSRTKASTQRSRDHEIREQRRHTAGEQCRGDFTLQPCVCSLFHDWRLYRKWQTNNSVLTGTEATQTPSVASKSCNCLKTTRRNEDEWKERIIGRKTWCVWHMWTDVW